ncbi:AraC family transcriptional regulator [Labrys miyagiensis]|uniref:AraC family transcriptional regulator n=1 Tax=Labrys miyagiensis TaxID=346912 RepID=A0ABQ6CB10_9HYPH|nr:AraC family transcriptional regulator [Labrys miyagiensis]GLS17488.1 AraC family transcriptional regulator [Labrys miyagiensis]
MLTALAANGPFRHTISLPRRRDRLHVMPTSTGYEIASAPSYDWDGRKRGSTPFSILQHTIAGRGNLHYERRRYTIGPGDTMLVTIPHAHRYWVEQGESWSFFWIAMCGQEALRLHRAILAAAGPVFRLRPETIDTLAAISIGLADGGLAAGKASGLAYHATMALHDDLMARHESAPDAGGHLAIGRVTSHIRRHLDQDLEVPALADIAGMSRAHFSRTFRTVAGVAPSEFVMRERMQLAARLLVNGQLSIKAIASTCGFADPNYFAKAFRRTFAISPSEFRTTGMYAARSAGA